MFLKVYFLSSFFPPLLIKEFLLIYLNDKSLVYLPGNQMFGSSSPVAQIKCRVMWAVCAPGRESSFLGSFSSAALKTCTPGAAPGAPGPHSYSCHSPPCLPLGKLVTLALKEVSQCHLCPQPVAQNSQERYF